MVGVLWVTFIISSLAYLPTLQAIDDCFLQVEGLIVPVFTPVDDYGNINYDIIPQYAQYLRDIGANGVYVGATAGEGPSLNVSSNKKLLDAWMAIAPSLKLLVVAGVGAVPFPDTLEMTRYAEKIGVDAIFAKPEVYFKPECAEDLVYNIQLIAEAAPNTPIVYDDFPQYTGVEVDIVEFFELATDKIPNFRGVKSNEIENLLLLRPKKNDQQKLYTADYINLASAVFLRDFEYVLVQANFFPELILDIINYGEKGNLTRAKNDYQRLIDLIDIIIEKGNVIAALKRAMPLTAGIDAGPPLDPIKDLTADEKENQVQQLKSENVPIVTSETYYDQATKGNKRNSFFNFHKLGLYVKNKRVLDFLKHRPIHF